MFAMLEGDIIPNWMVNFRKIGGFLSLVILIETHQFFRPIFFVISTQSWTTRTSVTRNKVGRAAKHRTRSLFNEWWSRQGSLQHHSILATTSMETETPAAGVLRDADLVRRERLISICSSDLTFSMKLNLSFRLGRLDCSRFSNSISTALRMRS